MLKNLFKNRRQMDNNGFVITMAVVVLVLGLVLIIGGLLFLMWLINNLMNLVLPLAIIVVIAILAKRFLLDKKEVATK